jgi:hypothetical protein
VCEALLYWGLLCVHVYPFLPLHPAYHSSAHPGGVRVFAMVSGGLIPEERRGSTYVAG